MITSELKLVVAALRGPIQNFARESRVRLVLLLDRSGQILAQQGFTSDHDLVSMSALAAAAHTAAQALAGMAGQGSWVHLHHDGRERQLFLAPFRIPTREFILVALFDRESSLGLVQYFFEEFCGRVADLPALSERGWSGNAESFEVELEAGLRTVAPPEWLE